jgi:hypothetical protein
MNRRSILSLVAITAWGLAGLPGSAVAQQKTLKEQLTGAWTLVSSETTAANGAKQQFYGGNPKGILILDAGGRYAAVQGRPDRPKPKTASRFQVSATELGEAAKEFAANFGTWSVNEADKSITRKFEGALNPLNEGSEQKSSVALAGDELKLSTVSPVTGDRNDTAYRRAK